MAQIFINSLHFEREGYSVSGQINVGQNKHVEFSMTDLTKEEADSLDQVFDTIKERLHHEMKTAFDET